MLKLFKNNKIDSFHNINSNNLNKFWDKLKEKYKDDSIRKFVAELKVFLNWSIKQGVFSADEFRKLEFPKLTTKVRDKVFTDENWQKINEITKHDKDFNLYLNTLYYTGCRPSEILDMTKSDIEENGIIKIYQNKVKKYKYSTVPPSLLNAILSVDNDIIFKVRFVVGYRGYIACFIRLYRYISSAKSNTSLCIITPYIIKSSKKIYVLIPGIIESVIEVV